MKQSGRIDGFYTHTMTLDPIEKGQNLLLPLLLATACVLAGVVCLSDVKPEQPFWVLTALLTAAMPLSLPCGGSAAHAAAGPCAQPQRLCRVGVLRGKECQRLSPHYHYR
ncbi:MAG: hypothetical protein ACLUNQ_02870 [Oscillospiraceae bacterium]